MNQYVSTYLKGFRSRFLLHLLRAVTYSEVNSHGPSHLLLFLDTSAINKTAEGSKHCRRQSMIWRQNARRLPPTGATPSPYPLTCLPVGAYLLVYNPLYFSATRLRKISGNFSDNSSCSLREIRFFRAPHSLNTADDQLNSSAANASSVKNYSHSGAASERLVFVSGER